MSRIDAASAWLRKWILPMMALAMMAGILLGRAAVSAAWGWAGFGCAAAALALGIRVPAIRRPAVIAMTMAMGMLLGFNTWHGVLPEPGTYRVTGVVAEEIRDGSRGQHKTILRNVTLNGERWGDGAYWTFYGAELPEGLTPGAAVEAEMKLYRPAEADNPGGFDFREYLLQRRCSIGLYGDTDLRVDRDRVSLTGLAAAFRHRLTSGLCAVMGETAGGYAATMILGERSLIDTEDRDAFARLGIAHVLSVSGFHVGVLYAAVAWILRKMGVSRRVRFPLIAALLAFYCLLTGMGAPVLRASALALLNEWGHLRHRQRSGLHLLSAAAMITLLISPAQLTGAGFQLSYGAMLGLTLILPSLRWRIRVKVRGRVRRRILDGLAASLAVQIGILLPQLYWFHEFPLLSVALNALVLAAASVMLTLYWAVLACMWIPVIGTLLGQLAGTLTEWLTGSVVWLGSMDWVSLWTCQANLWTALGCLMIFAGAGWLWRMRGSIRIPLMAVGLTMTVLSVIPWPHTGTEYIQLSVRSADAAVLRDGDTVWVIDTGESSTLSTYLHQRRLSVDTLVLTHLHRDHALGAAWLAQDRIPVRRVIIPEGAERQKDLAEECLAALDSLAARGTEIIHAARGDRFAFPSGSATVLWPERGRVRDGKDPNGYSLALLLNVKGTSLLTAGDLTSDYEMYSAVPAGILKVAHHGSYGSTSPGYLAAVDPETLLLSNAATFRHERITRMAGDRALFATQAVGAVTVTFGDGTYTVRGYRPDSLQEDAESEEDHGTE